MYSISDSITKVVGSHNFKAGVYWEWGRKIETAGGNSQGTYSFSGTEDPFFQAKPRRPQPSATSKLCRRPKLSLKTKGPGGLCQDNWRRGV
jgi:hypothetical protein